MIENNEKLNFEGQIKINCLSKIYHRKLETLLIYINIPRKKKNIIFFDDFFNIKEVCSYINTIENDVEEEEKNYLHENKNSRNGNTKENTNINENDNISGNDCSVENINLNTENEIKTDKNIFIKNLLLFLNNLIILYFSKSNLIDVCINRRSYNKCGFYACDNTFINNINKSKYKIDTKNKNIYLREYYDLFCSTNCMNFNMCLLKQIINGTKNSREILDCKKKCQLIHIMFLTFFPFFKFYDIKFLLDNIDKVNIQNNKIYIKKEEFQKDENKLPKIEVQEEKESDYIKSSASKKFIDSNFPVKLKENNDDIEVDEKKNNIKEIIKENQNNIKEIIDEINNNITKNYEEDEIKIRDKQSGNIRKDDPIILQKKKK